MTMLKREKTSHRLGETNLCKSHIQKITYPTKVLYTECIKKSPISTERNIQFRKWGKISRQFNQREYMAKMKNTKNVEQRALILI